MSSTSTSSRTTVMAVSLEARWMARDRDMSSMENPLRGNPGSKWRRIAIMAPVSELFLQLMYITSIGRPSLKR